MNPAEAGQVEYEEPDWVERFDQECARWPRLPRWLQEDNAFSEVMRQWRRFHSTPIQVDGEWKRQPASAPEAMAALAAVKVMPPRSAWREILHSDVVEGYQHDDHCWLSISGEQWRITGIEDRMLFLERMWFDERDREAKQIDLNRARWDSYAESAAAVLKAMRQSD